MQCFLIIFYLDLVAYVKSTNVSLHYNTLLFLFAPSVGSVYNLGNFIYSSANFPDTFDLFEGARSAISRIDAVHFLFLAVLVL